MYVIDSYNLAYIRRSRIGRTLSPYCLRQCYLSLEAWQNLAVLSPCLLCRDSSRSFALFVIIRGDFQIELGAIHHSGIAPILPFLPRRPPYSIFLDIILSANPSCQCRRLFFHCRSRIRSPLQQQSGRAPGDLARTVLSCHIMTLFCIRCSCVRMHAVPARHAADF